MEAKRTLGPKSGTNEGGSAKASSKKKFGPKASQSSSHNSLSPKTISKGLGKAASAGGRDSDRKVSPRRFGSQGSEDGGQSSNYPSTNTGSHKNGKDLKSENFSSSTAPGRGNIKALPRLADVPPEGQRELFSQKLHACSAVFDFRIDTHMPEKEWKRQTLLELVEYVSSAKASFDAPSVKAAISMVSTNIFRTLAKREHDPYEIFDAEIDTPALDPAWSHLEPVYELFRQLVLDKCVELASAEKLLNKQFVTKMFDLLDSEDPRERDTLKAILRRIYEKFSSLRSCVRRGIRHTCLHAVHENEVHNGVGELLDLVVRIIGKSPLSDESKDFMHHVLIPLHKVGSLVTFHKQLLECIKRYIEKDSTLIYHVVMALIRFWPFSMQSKQIRFLDELEEMLSVIPPPDFRRLRDVLARLLARCLSSPNSDVAERALGFWKNDKVVKLITQNCRDQFPIIISALYENATQHCNNPAFDHTLEVLKLLMVADPELFDLSSARHRKEAEEKEQRQLERERKWAALQAAFDGKLRAPTRRRTGRGRSFPPRSEKDSTAAMSGIDLDSPKAPPQLNTQRVELQLEKDRYGVAVSWDRHDAELSLGLQALLVSKQGKVIAAIHELNRAALGAAVWHVSGDTAGCPPGCGGAIWVNLPRLPQQVVLLVFVLVAHAGHLRDAVSGAVRASAEGSESSVAEFAVDPGATGNVGVIMMVRRSGPDAWTLVRVEEYPGPGRHYMDILEPALGRLIREAVPGVPKRQKATLAFAGMERGAVADLPLPPGPAARPERGAVGEPLPKWLFVGVGWDLSEYASEGSLAIAVAALFFDAHGREIGAVSSESREACGARHSGDGHLGAGVILDLAAVPREAAQVFVLANVSDASMTFDRVQRPHCCIVDSFGGELARYTVSDGPCLPGLLIARLFRGAGGERWGFEAVGQFCGGNTWKSSLGDVRSAFHTAPGALQVVPEDATGLPAHTRTIVSL